MQNKTLTFLLLNAMLAMTACQDQLQQPPAEHALTTYVDPFMGTAEHGHVYPGATVPFGMVQLSPDNGTPGWDWCAGYNWADDRIVGFSHTHLSGTGIGDLYDISVMPALEKIDFSLNTPPRESSYAAVFSHENEKASPGYYAVKFNNGIETELTTTERTGLHHYRFPDTGQSNLLLDLGFALNWDKPLETRIRIASPNTLTGHRFSTGWARDQRIFFAIEFSANFSNWEIADSTAILASGQTENGTDGTFTGRQLRAQFQFDQTKDLLVKVGISSADEESAIAALREVPNWDFQQVRQAAAEKWEKELSKIRVTSANETQKKIFYTSFYRTCLAPVLFSDANGRYKASTSGAGANWDHSPFYPNGAQVRQADGYNRYDIFSLWDTFRAANPLFTLTQPERINDMIRSFLAHYDEYGLLPVWSLLGNETNTMTGYHCIPIIVDAYRKGFREYDVDKAYQAMIKSANQPVRATPDYIEYGYIPYDKAGESVTRTLEYAYDDWCIAQMARDLGHEDDYNTFMKRAGSYRQLFDSSTGFMRAKLSDGSWKKPFDPQFSDHNFEVAEYTEGNAWQHSWFVPHDVKGLIELHGGKEAFVRKLDSLFTVSSELKGENVSADISGLIGQYAHGNEPSHHIAYLYNYAGMPWKTQEKVHEICNSQYNETPAGLCGNEDCGQMSAWYVFSALGFYPVNPAEGRYVIGSPFFEEVTWEITPGKTFRILANHMSGENKYIQSATLNGKPLDRSYILHEEIRNGGELRFEMGPAPNTALWSTTEALPSE